MGWCFNMEIIKNDIKVTIVCTTYNHEKYIKDALDGFIIQKTNFKYCVLVHDDASTDRTPQIIEEYHRKYPDLIIPILQKENKYSKVISIVREIIWPQINSDYIAMCEGDDFWIDEYKLQKQYNAMEKHPEVDFCANAGLLLRNSNYIGENRASEVETKFSTEKLLNEDGNFILTASWFYRRTMLKKIPDFYKIMGFDYNMQLWGSLRGGILYLPDVMTVYRVASEGSWSQRINKNNKKFAAWLRKVNTSMVAFNVDTNYRFNDIVDAAINERCFRIAVLESDFKTLLSISTLKTYASMTLKNKIKYVAKIILCWFNNKK